MTDSMVFNNTAQHAGGGECFMCFRFTSVR